MKIEMNKLEQKNIFKPFQLVIDVETLQEANELYLRLGSGMMGLEMGVERVEINLEVIPERFGAVYGGACMGFPYRELARVIHACIEDAT